MADRLRLGERQHAAFALEGVDATADLGGGLARKSLARQAFALGGHGEVLDLGQRRVATGDPGGEQFGVCGLAAGRVGAVARGLAGTDRVDHAAEGGLHIVDLTEHDRLGEVGGLVGAIGDLGSALGARVVRELPEDLSEANQTLEVCCVGQDGGLRRCFDRGFEPHLGHLPLEGHRAFTRACGAPLHAEHRSHRRPCARNEDAERRRGAIHLVWGSRPRPTESEGNELPASITASHVGRIQRSNAE